MAGQPMDEMLRRKASEPVSLELRVSIGQFLSDYESSSIKTKRNYEQNMVAFQRFADGRAIRHLEEIDAQVLRDFLAQQREYTYTRPRSTVIKHLSTATLQQRQGTVRTWLRWAVRQGQIESCPMDLVRPIKGEVRARLPYDLSEARRLVSESGKGNGWFGYRDKAIVLLLLGTGARADELLSLTPRHFEWRNNENTCGGTKGEINRVVLNGKGSRDRRVPVGEKAAAAVRAYIKNRPAWIPTAPSSPLFWTFRQEPMPYSALNAMCKSLGGYADVANCIPHRFRHTFASDFYRTNKDIVALQNRLGHSKIETTMNYLKSLGVDYGYGDEYRSPDELY